MDRYGYKKFPRGIFWLGLVSLVGCLEPVAEEEGGPSLASYSAPDVDEECTDLNTSGEPIEGGEEDTAHPEVVALIRQGEGVFCSGVLIAPDAVLTAAHCLLQFPLDEIEVFFGRDASAHDGFSVSVATVFLQPLFQPETLENDVGIIILQEEVTSVTPALLPDFLLTESDLESELTFVGFFPDSIEGGCGTRRSATVTLKAISQTNLMYLWQGAEADLPPGVPEFGPCDCLREAGTAAFLVRGGVKYLIGVNSFSSDDCTSFGVNFRTDRQLGFIDKLLEI